MLSSDKNNELGRQIGDEYHAFLIVIMKTLLYIDEKGKIGQGYHKLGATIVSITFFNNMLSIYTYILVIGYI